MSLKTKEALRLVIFITLIGLFTSLATARSAAQTNDNYNVFFNPQIVELNPTIIGVTHNPINPDSEHAIYVSATIFDIDGISLAVLFYRAVGASSWNSTGLPQVGSTEVYEAPIGPYNAGLSVEYYIYAEDATASHYSTTNDNDGEYYSFTVTEADHEAPEITNVQHTPGVPTDNDLIEISCDVIDASPVIVKLNFRVNDSEWANQTMVNTEGYTYTTTVGEFNIGTLFEYRIYAIDQSLNNNTNLENAGGENYYFTVVINDTVAPVITNVLLDPGTVLEGQTVIISCSVADDYNNVLNVTLYYRINGGTWLQASFVLTEGYHVTIGPFVMDDLIEFYIVAFDDSQNKNSRINDNSGSYFSFTVLEGTEGTSLYALIPFVAILGISVIIKRKK